ncbi:MAG: eS25 family ribosomal protein [Candidatus Bathyarchaeia archaeon]|jgi:ribosomal protein S25
MGGKKKLGIKQMEKQQVKEDEDKSKEKKKDKAGMSKERRTVGIMPPDAKNDKIVSEVKKMNVLTPYAVSTRFNIRISTAKDFLEQLEANGAVQLVSGSHNIKIYKPAAS